MLREVVLLVLCVAVAVNAQSGQGKATYHAYTRDFSMLTVACSDGVNGLYTRFGYTTLAPLYPYVSASSFVGGWNSANCGKCATVTSKRTGKSIKVTLVDASSAYANHFDLSPEAFTELFGSKDSGVEDVSFSIGSGPCGKASSSSSSTSTTGSSGSCSYTVKKGDTLYSIATARGGGLTWEKLCDLNNMRPNCNTLWVGQVIKLC